MYYKQLKDFLRAREQRAFFIFSYQNMVGLFLGWIVARYISNMLAFLPGIIVIPTCLLAGLAATWPQHGRERYKTWGMWLAYLARRLFSKGSLVLHSSAYYRVDNRFIRPFAIQGKVAFGGDGGPTSDQSVSRPTSLVPHAALLPAFATTAPPTSAAPTTSPSLASTGPITTPLSSDEQTEVSASSLQLLV